MQSLIRAAVERLRGTAPSESVEAKISEITALLADKKYADIERMLQISSDKHEFFRLIDSAVRAHFGQDYIYTVHGVTKRFEKRFDGDQLNKVFGAIGRFQSQLLGYMGIESFLASGTLLGLIRDGAVISHDDDFDACYVSRETDRTAIVAERLAIMNWIDASTDFTPKEATGGHFHVFHKSLPLMFDLFTGWIEGPFFNEYPLIPDTLAASDVVPVKTVCFYDAEVFVPHNPEALLALNYGPNWRKPDPTWRFDWDATGAYYSFLTSQRIK